MRTSTIKRAAALGAAALIGATALVAAPAANAATGNNSLASVLGVGDKAGFDKVGTDYDVVTAAAEAVLGAKPDSPVGLLADGKVALTAFIPNDRAFEILASQLSGKTVTDEEAAFKVVAGLGIDTVETVLLYHVVPGKAILAADALKANGAKLKTAVDGQGHRRQGHEQAGDHPRRLRPEAGQPARHPQPDQHQQGQQAGRARHQPGAPAHRSLISHPSTRRPPAPAGGLRGVRRRVRTCAGGARRGRPGWPGPSSPTRGHRRRCSSSVRRLLRAHPR